MQSLRDWYKQVSDFLKPSTSVVALKEVPKFLVIAFALEMFSLNILGVAAIANTFWPATWCWLDIKPIMASEFFIWLNGFVVLLNQGIRNAFITSTLDFGDLIGLSEWMNENIPFLWFMIGLAPACIFAPILEELEFRWPLLYLRDKVSPITWWGCALILGTLFCVIHPYPLMSMIAVGMCPIVNTWLILKTGRLWPCMVIHCLYNFHVSIL